MMKNLKKENIMQTIDNEKLTVTKKLSLAEGKELAFQLIDKLDKNMKNIKSITIILALATSFNLSAQNAGVYDDFIYNNTIPIDHKVSSVVSHVTLFNSQAQVTRTAKINLEASGVFNIVFDKLSPYINMNSLEVKANEHLTILSVSNRNDLLNKNEKPADIILLEDSLVNINAALADFKADKETIVHQKDLMLANKNVGSNQTGVKYDELEDLMNLYHKKLDDFKVNWFRLSKLETKYYAYKNAVEQQLAAYNNGKLTLNNEVILTVKSDNKVQDAQIDLSYLVGNVSWQPFYDIRIKDNKSNVQFFLKANITQSTGEDWSNVNLKLTTANPAEGGIKPELQTNWLGFFIRREYVQEVQIAGSRAKKIENLDNVTILYDKASKPTVTQNLFNTEFETNIAYTIPSDNQNHQVDLTSFAQSAIYGYAVVPKLNKEVFVTAQVLANDLINQISGEANVYFDGTFTGKTFVSPTANDTLLLTLGKDKRVQVERIKLKDYSSKSFFGSTKKEQTTFEIKVKNTQKDAIILTIEDQIPVSNNSEIEVKLLEYEGATYDVNTGKLTWKMELKADESKSVKFGFEVKHPKDKPLTGY
ncbi:MAG: DUF4139 domain-containing protein [Bacteroidia bacterium]